MNEAARRKFFSGNTLQQALVAAACHFGLEPEEVAYQEVEKRHGFLRVRRRVVIAVDPATPRREPRPEPPARPAEGERRQRPPADRERTDRPPRPARPERAGGPGGPREPEMPWRPSEGGGSIEVQACREATERLRRVAELEVSATVHEGDGRLEVDLAGPDEARLLAGEGDLLLALDYLVPRLVSRLVGRTVYCRVNSQRFHETREERLREMAREVAREVRERGEARALEPLSPAERRIVHMTLAEDPAVETESEGEGFFKRLTVRPV